MLWLTDGEELSDVLVPKGPLALVDVVIAGGIVDKEGVELRLTDVDSVEDTDTLRASLTDWKEP